MKTKQKILIVDDDTSLIDALSVLLDSEGYSVSSLYSGTGLMSQLNTGKTDVLILDYMLPGEDGLQLLKKIRSNPKTSKIPVIMMSASLSMAQSAKTSGANVFIPKPFDLPKFLRVVRKYASVANL